MRFHTLQDGNRNGERILVYGDISSAHVYRLFFEKDVVFVFSIR